MLKTIKVSEKAYNDLKKLKTELEKDKDISDIFRVNLSTAVSYAAKKALEIREKKKRFLSSAGGWSDINGKKLIKDIYDSRGKGTRWSLSFD